MTGNIIGEEFLPYVINQIQSRQTKHGKGMSGNLRSYEDINYLSNRNAWIKMASSVQVDDSIRVKNIGLDSGGAFNGINLAKKAILFNTLVDFKNGGGIDEKTNSDILPVYKTRHGVSKSTDVWNNSAYGLGGIDFGLQPPPGITSVSIDTVNRGSIRKATINLKAYNKFQFELIELLYLRIGFTMMLEWGWDKYIDDNTKKVEPMGNTLIENWWFNAGNTTQLDVLKQIESYRLRYCGNYDGFFGKVCNYHWQFQSDGSYDISLNLITVGDVIESLQARVTATSNFLTNVPQGYSSIFTSMGQTVIDQWLYESIHNDVFADGTDYIIQQVAQQGLMTQKSLSGGVSSDNSSIDSPELIKYKYYVTFGELIKKLSELCIPKIKNGTSEAPQLYFDDDFDNILIKVFPNQIAIDPRVCLFEPYLSNKDFQEINDDMGSLKQYTVPKDGVIFGQLMNLYLNFNFIMKTLKTNVDKNNNMSLYRFLEDICNDINSALGGVNKIQPIIKDDNIITFIDQALQSSTILNKNKKDTAVIEVYGYNMDNKDNITSNFVKNIDFETKLAKETSAMISIGATAGGNETSIKNGDATAFSKWNEGLVDRFCQNISDPLEKPSLTPLESHAASLEINSSTQNNIPSLSAANIQSKYQAATLKFLPKNEMYKYDAVDWEFVTRHVINLLKDPSYTIDEYTESYQNIIKYIVQQEKTMVEDFVKKETQSKSSFITDSSTAYLAYLIEAFGGTPSQQIYDNGKLINYSKNSTDGQYFKFNPQFIEKGKSLYQAYISYKSRLNYSQTKNQSSQIGFLPLEFTLTTDGISGMKIYNKLNISQHFLPRNYPTSFDFVVIKLNHKIDNMGWDTEIGTLNTSNIDDKLDEKITGDNLVVKAGSGMGDCTTKYPNLPIISPPSIDSTPMKTVAIYLKNHHPTVAKQVFAIIMAEARHTATNFTSAGGNNFGGIQTDVGRWTGGQIFSGQFCRRDAERKRMFAVFKSVNDFLDFTAGRAKGEGKRFDLATNADEWVIKYINNWWSPAAKAKYTKGTAMYKSKLSIYKTAEKIYNSLT